MLNSNSNDIKKYCRVNNRKISPFLNDVFMDQNIINTEDKNSCDIFIPKSNNELKMFNFPSKTIIGSIDNINHFNKKNRLWNNLVQKYGLQKAGLIIPPTYNILEKQDLRKFAEHYLYKKSDYILKNEQESARGILVSNDLKEMTQHILDKKQIGFPVTVVQPLIKSYLIAGRVFKMRMYLFIKCNAKSGIKSYYLHNLGGIFYAPETYDRKNLNNNNIIANGYWYNSIDHTDYIGFIGDKPRTLKELYTYLEKDNINSKKIMEQVVKLLILIIKSVENKIYKKKYNNDQFCILGFDVMIDENHKPWIIEFNKGPSTSSYDDANVYNTKKKVWNDIYNLIQNKPHKFKEIYRY